MSKIIYHGHSFVEIKTQNEVIYIDPFIETNDTEIAKRHCDIELKDAKCSYIILTHGHADHFGNTIEIAKGNDTTVIAMVEITDYLYTKDVKGHGMNIGGAYNFPFGKVKFTLAHHSSSLPDGTYAGNPAGVLLSIDNKTIFHAGDTSLFYDMKLIGETNKIDIAFLPIGDNYTMGIDDAVKAAEFLRAEMIVPIHYDTYEVIKADPNEFKRKIESIGKKCLVMKPGDAIEL